jgi:hypothetical protein
MGTEPFFRDLPGEPVKAVLVVCDRVIAFDAGRTGGERLQGYEMYLDVLSEIVRFSELHDLKLEFPGLTPNRLSNIHRIVEFFHSLRFSIEKNMPTGRGKSGRVHAQPLESLYFDGLSVSDPVKAQRSLDGLRHLFKSSAEFDPGLKRKLLKRLESLQGELNRAHTPSTGLLDFI